MTAIAQTNSGRIEGLSQDGLNIFKGIPYAASPTAVRRWLPPGPVEPWTGTRPAQSFGPIAPQNPSQLEIISSPAEPEPQDEDCLYLNVWTPGLDSVRSPVMVWIHGGAFVTGSGSGLVYDGASLSNRGDTVIVTINYRMGPFGFLNLSSVTDGRIPATGNEGLLDMIAALEWVRENISNFGGDPANVTIFGESAGGMAIGALLVMPSAKGLFHKAILESGSNTVHSPERSKKVAKRYLEVLNISADGVETLKSLSTAEWLAALEQVAQPNPETGVMPMQPVIDGDLLPELPLAGLANGVADGVPILIGSNLEEWKLMSGLDPEMAGLDETGMVDRLSQSASNWDILEVIKAYQQARENRGAETSHREVFTAIQTDRIYRIPAVRLLETHRKRGNPAYNYLFTWTSPLLDGVLGACHALEIAFVFGTYKLGEAFFGSGTAADDLSGKIQEAWLAFARTGNPSCGALGTWPAYGEQKRTMLLGKDTKIADALYEEERLAWESVPDTITGIL